MSTRAIAEKDDHAIVLELPSDSVFVQLHKFVAEAESVYYITLDASEHTAVVAGNLTSLLAHLSKYDSPCSCTTPRGQSCVNDDRHELYKRVQAEVNRIS